MLLSKSLDCSFEDDRVEEEEIEDIMTLCQLKETESLGEEERDDTYCL